MTFVTGYSPVCAVCRADHPAQTAANIAEREHREHPAEVDERVCRTCGENKRWWWFTVTGGT